MGRLDGYDADHQAQTWGICANGVKLGLQVRTRVYEQYLVQVSQ